MLHNCLYHRCKLLQSMHPIFPAFRYLIFWYPCGLCYDSRCKSNSRVILREQLLLSGSFN
ncbi:hypothetical protein ACS0TY_023409 [Phlomoides rotata]